MCLCVCANSKMMDVCGEAETRLATELMQHEMQIEKDILDPLNQLAEVKRTHCHLLPFILPVGNLCCLWPRMLFFEFTLLYV